jgi:hypothetical protein
VGRDECVIPPAERKVDGDSQLRGEGDLRGRQGRRDIIGRNAAPG